MPNNTAELSESVALQEATLEGRTLHLTLIRAGFNTSKTRYYTEAALRSGVEAFSGAQQYLDHPTRTQAQERPEGSVRDWVATIGSVSYDAESQSLRGTAKIIDPDFLERVKLMDEQGLLHTLGVSIRAIGVGEDAEVHGHRTFRVDQFTEGISADFVTRPGAGGYVEFRESDNTPSKENDDMTVEAVAAAERRAVEAEQRAKEAERRAEAAEKSAREAQEAAAVANSALEKMKAEAALRDSQEAIGRLIDAAKLPEQGAKYLRGLLATESDVEKAKAEVERFTNMIREAVPNSPVRNMGESAPVDDEFTESALDDRIGALFGGA